MINQVFISYRQESPEQAREVLRLGELLRRSGLPVALDQFLVQERPGGPDEGWPKWCEDCANDSACVLVIASVGWFAAYDGDAPPGIGRGAASEARLFRQYLYDASGRNPRIRLVLIDDLDPDGVPAGLRAWHRFRPFATDAELDQLVQWAKQRLALADSEPPARAESNPSPPPSPTPASKRPSMDEATWDRQRRPLRDLLVGLPAWSLVRDRKAFVESALGNHPAIDGQIWDDDPYTAAGNLVQRLEFFDAVPLSDGRHAVCGLLAEVHARGWHQNPGIGSKVLGLAEAFGCAVP